MAMTCRCAPNARCGKCEDFVENQHTCDACGETKAVTIQHKVRVFGVLHRWRNCTACELRERELGDAREQAAIEEAERSGV